MGKSEFEGVVLCGRSEQAPTLTIFLTFEHIENLKQNV